MKRILYSKPENATKPPTQSPDTDKIGESTGLELTSSAKTFHIMTILLLTYVYVPIFPSYVNTPIKQLQCWDSSMNLLAPLLVLLC